VRWMVPFAMSIREAGSSALKTFKGIAADDMHNIQTHVAYLEWLVSFIFIFIFFNFFSHLTLGHNLTFSGQFACTIKTWGFNTIVLSCSD